jgi:hypothetical protein
MKKSLIVALGISLIFGLSGCGSASTPEPTPTPSLTFEDLQSQFAQQLGVKGCMAFMSGQYQVASNYFHILATIVPEWEGYDIGVLREGKAFNAARCF